MEKNKKIGGQTLKSIVIPFVIIFLVQMCSIIGAIITINISSNELDKVTSQYNKYSAECTSLLAGASLLSETSSAFVMNPINENGDVQVGSLIAYVNELTTNPQKRGNQVVAKFSEYGLDGEIFNFISNAAKSANYMLNEQLHAIALVRSVYPLPNINSLAGLPAYSLSDEELALSNEERLAKAQDLLFETTYSRHRNTIFTSINNANSLIRDMMVNEVNEASKALMVSRIMLWVITISIIILVSIVTVMLYIQFVFPISKFSKQITKDEPLDDKRGLYEIRLLANAYNGLLTRKHTREQSLKKSAEIDSLTGFQNQICFNQFLSTNLENDLNEKAIFVFDVYNVKRTNEINGHLAGDNLILRGSKCIAEVFGNENKTNCYRFGGDEFAVYLVGYSNEQLSELCEKFEQKQKEYSCTISYGYSYSNDNQSTMRDIFRRADKQMYSHKEKINKK